MSAPRSVLFVDDEALVLQGLRRSAHAWRQDWTCEFVESGAAALARLAERSFDVMVTDIMMPGMNGAELLETVRERHPGVVRFVLSGQAEAGLARRCVRSTHRYLDKPCEPQMLKAALEGATSLAFSLQNEALAKLVCRIDRLPSPPHVAQELEKRLQSPTFAIEEIGELIARDVAMTAQILKIVNSAYFGIARPLESAAEAVSYLGVDAIRSMVLFSGLTEQMKQLGVTPARVEALWSHSLLVSAAARRIAALERAPRGVIKEAETAGLLHDAGKLILMLNFPGQSDRIAAAAEEAHITLALAEQRELGCTHAEVGGYLFALWGLTLPVVQAVAWHHRPEAEPALVFSSTTAVHVADGMIHTCCHEPEGGAENAFDETYLRARGLMRRIPDWRAAVESLLSGR